MQSKKLCRCLALCDCVCMSVKDHLIDTTRLFGKKGNE